MTGEQIERAEGRWLFGQNPGRYQAARPDYPDRVYEILVDPCGLADGCRVLEVGAGAGQVTEHLAKHGARPIVAIEPDSNFCEVLEELAKRVGGAVVPISTTFEAAELERGTFDLAVSATAFHWLDRESGPRDLGACLRPGGWLALFWNTFGDPRAPDPFHDATDSILSNLASSPSHPIERPLPFALDREGRLADFQAAGCQAQFAHEEIRWTLELSPEGVRALYATFSPIARLPEKRRELVLESLEVIARDTFGGRVERNMVTSIYRGRRA